MSKQEKPTSYKLRVQFMDEAPRIGNGWRIVYVHEGHKWVKVRDCLGNKAKFTWAQWEKIAATASELGPSNKRTAEAFNDSGVFLPFICIPGDES